MKLPDFLAKRINEISGVKDAFLGIFPSKEEPEKEEHT